LWAAASPLEHFGELGLSNEMMHRALCAKDAVQRLGCLIAPADMVVAIKQHQPVRQTVDRRVNTFEFGAELTQRCLLLPGKPVQAFNQRRPDAPPNR